MKRSSKKQQTQESTGKVEEKYAKPLFKDLEENLTFLEETLGKSSDLVIRRFTLDKSKRCGVLYIDGMVDKDTVQHYVMDALLLEAPKTGLSFRHVYDTLKDSALPIGELTETSQFDDLLLKLLSGETIVLIDHEKKGLSASTKGWANRGVQENTSEGVIRGPKEAFTETLRFNTSMLRRKIKDPDLRMDAKRIGRMTKTDTVVVYIKDTADQSIVDEVHARLDKIDIDGVLESGYIEEYIEDPPYSPFPRVYYSERPDAIAAGLLEGRVAIITDGTPNVLLVPGLFVHFMQSSEDYYQRFDIGTVIRLLRLFALFVSLFMPALYIGVTTFHQEMIPAPLLISLAAQREGVPFPAFVEAVLMELAFEVLREAGVRLPRPVGSAVSIVGALVLGDAAVQAGLVSPAMVIVVAITAISSFVIPSYNMAISVRMLRFLLMLLAAVFGLYGIILGLIALVLHLTSLNSFGIPYLSPFAPLVVKDQKDVLVRFPHWGLFTRPQPLARNNQKRMSEPSKSKEETK
ncbi:spore germination protein [Halobacillus massiliensis]|uniref:spore germination protein n=1 Tax=Halobacillus massiliensis TaxID=1926286 RepID=UPI0009E31F94|nr:spore germination protein [Halobacillus massiliensis]